MYSRSSADLSYELAAVQRYIGQTTRSAVSYGGDLSASRADAAQIGWRDLVPAQQPDDLTGSSQPS